MTIVEATCKNGQRFASLKINKSNGVYWVFIDNGWVGFENSVLNLNDLWHGF